MSIRNNLLDQILAAIQAGGSTSRDTGWVSITDTTKTSGTPLSLIANTRTLLSLNADSVIEPHAPTGTTASDFYNNTSKKLFGATEGDSYDLRITFTADPATTNTNLFWELDIGGSQGVIFEDSKPLLKGSAAERYVQIIPYFTLGTFQANGGDLYLEATSDTDIYDISALLVRTSKGA